MKVLFVDHSYHKLTTSSLFLVELLRQFFDVDVFFADPEDPHSIIKLNKKTNFDVVVLWQMDFLAPFFLANGMPTVVIPMYDGSSGMPDLHWLWARNARFINFSRRLHERITGLGNESLLVRYYPKPHHSSDTEINHDDVRVFLWQRRPEHGLNLRAVERMFGSSLSAVHIHNATDDPSIDTDAYTTTERTDYKLTLSTWFESKTDYEKVLNQFNYFVAPRRSEGIGMGFLEAMARGMIVCAHDDATHNEYISNGLNGVLFNADLSQQISVGDVTHRRRLSAMAISSVEDGNRQWINSTLKIIDYIKSAKRDHKRVVQLASVDFLEGLVTAYYAGIRTYENFLCRNLKLASDLCDLNFEELLDDQLRYDPSRRLRVREGRLPSASNKMPWLHRNTIGAEEIASGSYIIRGSAYLRDETAWVDGERLILGFRVDTRISAIRKLHIEIRRQSTSPARYCVILNGTILDAAIIENEDTISLLVPEKAMFVDAELHIQVECGESDSDGSVENFGIRSLVFE